MARSGLTPKTETLAIATLCRERKLQVGKQRVGRYPLEFRRMAVARMSKTDNISALAEELGINRDLLYRWRGQLEATPATETASSEPAEDPRDTRLREENRLLKSALAEKSLEVDFFKGALQKIAARRQENKESGARVSTTRSGK
jgi:transposase